MFARSVIVAAFICLPCVALAQDPLTAIVNQPPQVNNIPPALLPPTPVSPPGAPPVTSGEWIISEQSKAPVFGMDLLLGQLVGIRPTVTLFSTEKSTLVVEGFYGALLTRFGSSEGAGAGLRWLMSRGGNDSVTFGPGLDVMFNFRDGQAVFLAPTIDLAWQHKFGERSTFQLGVNAGLGIGLSNYSNDHNYYYGDHNDSVTGKITPLISLFGGLRF
jgi:hypothetical protein